MPAAVSFVLICVSILGLFTLSFVPIHPGLIGIDEKNAAKVLWGEKSLQEGRTKWRRPSSWHSPLGLIFRVITCPATRQRTSS